MEAKKTSVAAFQKLAEEEATRVTSHRKGQAGSTRPAGVHPSEAPGATGVPLPPTTQAPGAAAQQQQPQQRGGGGGASRGAGTAPAPAPGHDDSLSERAFWASITLNPPMYGADTPMSFFDEKLVRSFPLAQLWRLRQL